MTTEKKMPESDMKFKDCPEYVNSVINDLERNIKHMNFNKIILIHKILVYIVQEIEKMVPSLSDPMPFLRLRARATDLARVVRKRVHKIKISFIREYKEYIEDLSHLQMPLYKKLEVMRSHYFTRTKFLDSVLKACEMNLDMKREMMIILIEEKYKVYERSRRCRK